MTSVAHRARPRAPAPLRHLHRRERLGDRGARRAASCPSLRPDSSSWTPYPSRCSGRRYGRRSLRSRLALRRSVRRRDKDRKACARRYPTPIRCPRQLPANIGPPGTMIAGISALAAPISCAGVVLSQPHKRTTPSRGFARMDSSTSIAIRLRNSMVVGRMNVSPSEIVGNSNGTPPAAHTPRFTASATSRRWRLQLFSSLQELQMPMIGFPWKTSEAKPSARIHERWTNAKRLVPSNQLRLRSVMSVPSPAPATSSTAAGTGTSASEAARPRSA